MMVGRVPVWQHTARDATRSKIKQRKQSFVADEVDYLPHDGDVGRSRCLFLPYFLDLSSCCVFLPAVVVGFQSIKGKPQGRLR